MNTTPRDFRRRTDKYALERKQCESCGRFDDYVAECCYHCGSEDLESVSLTPEGEIVTYVVQHYLPAEFDTPLPLGLVETPEGARILGMFTECDDPHDIDIGQRVEITIKRFAREDGQVKYEPKFDLVDGGADR